MGGGAGVASTLADVELLIGTWLPAWLVGFASEVHGCIEEANSFQVCFDCDFCFLSWNIPHIY